METFCQITLAGDLKYLSENNLIEIKPFFIEIAKMLSGWRTNLKSKSQSPSPLPRTS